jgi:hypothetical protein
MTTSSQTEAPAAGGSVVDSSVGKPTRPTHPVDSTTSPSCKAIGAHAPECSAVASDDAAAISFILKFRGAVISLRGSEATVRETVRLVLDCPSWCIRDHLDECDEEDVELHEGAPAEVPGVFTVDREQLSLVTEREAEHADGSGGLRIIIKSVGRGYIVDVTPEGAVTLGRALIGAAEQLAEAQQ